MKRTSVVVAMLLALSMFATAHGKEEQVMGTVEQVDAKVLVVRDARSDASVTIELTPNTKFERGGQAVSRDDVKPGDRVVVRVDRHGDQRLAVLVRLAGK